jgi:predicted DNA-binding transcriptional regulator YafY
LNKLMAALPVPMQAQAAAMRERLHVDPTGWRGTGEDLSMLVAVQEAVSGDRNLAFEYTKADGQTAPRIVEPLGVVAKGVTWYLVARGANGIRTYRVSRMAAVTVLAGKFERPAQFDLAAYWKQSTAQLDENRASFEVDLCVEAGAARRLAEWGVANSMKFDSSGRIIAPPVKPTLPADQPPAIDQPPDGWVRLTARFDSQEIAQFIILGFGATVRVVLPDDFRRRVLAEARKLIGAG